MVEFEFHTRDLGIVDEGGADPGIAEGEPLNEAHEFAAGARIEQADAELVGRVGDTVVARQITGAAVAASLNGQGIPVNEVDEKTVPPVLAVRIWCGLMIK